jgi:hypothetical protein
LRKTSVFFNKFLLKRDDLLSGFCCLNNEYEFGEKGFEKKQTASKRYTYLFGKGAKTRTARFFNWPITNKNCL